MTMKALVESMIDLNESRATTLLGGCDFLQDVILTLKGFVESMYAAKSSQEQPRAAKRSQGQSGAARSSQEQ